MKAAMIFKVACLAVALLGYSSCAAAGSDLCEVKEAGTYGKSEVRFKLTDTEQAFVNKDFKARSERPQEMLAVGLAALVSGMKVRVNTNPSAGDVPVISTMSLVQ